MDRADLYTIRLTYRYSGSQDVQTADFSTGDRGIESEAFLRNLKTLGKLDIETFSVIPFETATNGSAA
jgi:hypothetical protein